MYSWGKSSGRIMRGVSTKLKDEHLPKLSKPEVSIVFIKHEINSLIL